MKVQGKNVIVYIQSGTDWLPYLCARSATLDLSTEFIETSVSGTGTFATFLPTKNSFTGSLAGVVSVAEPDVFDLASLRAKQINQELLMMKFERTDDGGNVYLEQANFYIADSNDTGSYDDMNIFSIELQGTGAITQSVNPNIPSALQIFVVSVGLDDNVYFYGEPGVGDTVTLALSATNADTESPFYVILGGDTIVDLRDALDDAVNAGTLFSSTTLTAFTPTVGVSGLPSGVVLYGLKIHNVAGFGVTTIVTVT